MIDPKWAIFIDYCERNKHFVFDNLYIKDGKPDLGYIPQEKIGATLVKKSVIFRK